MLRQVTLFAVSRLGGRGTPRSAVDARKAPASPNGHGLRPPFGRALLSMPVRLLRRLTGTALRAAFRSPPAREGPAFPQRSDKRRSRRPSAKVLHPFPSALLSGKYTGAEATPLQGQAELVRIAFYLMELFVKIVCVSWNGPAPDSTQPPFQGLFRLNHFAC